MKKIFTCDEVVNLNKAQNSHALHPFTCPNRGDGNHRFLNGDTGALFATTRGWICPFCEYTQDWAHEFMKSGAISRTNWPIIASETDDDISADPAKAE